MEHDTATDHYLTSKKYKVFSMYSGKINASPVLPTPTDEPAQNQNHQVSGAPTQFMRSSQFDGLAPFSQSRGSPRAHTTALSPDVLQLAQAARNRYLYYTGTDKPTVERARNEGLSPATKGTSSIENAIDQNMFPHLSESEITARRHDAKANLYFTKRKEDFGGGLGAKSYAKLKAGESGTPILMRSYFKPSHQGLEPDPDSPGYAKAFRTNKHLAAGNVLPSSSAPASVTPATELFKQEFNTSGHRDALKINITLDSQKAAEIFHDLQTPSPVDFSDKPSN